MKRTFLPLLILLALLLAACAARPAPATQPASGDPPSSGSSGGNSGSSATQAAKVRPLVISAVSEGDPEKDKQLYESLASYLESKLGIPVTFKAYPEEAALVEAYRKGEVDLAYFDGVSGMQARMKNFGAQAFIQRDVDAQVRSVFIASKASGLAPIEDASGLAALKGHSFTYSTKRSTTGRGMPAYYLSKAMVFGKDFKSEPVFSETEAQTIELVSAGTYDAGALSETEWDSAVKSGKADPAKVILLWRTPEYYDHHWLMRADYIANYNSSFIDKVAAAFSAIDASTPEGKRILELSGAGKFISTTNGNYDALENTARALETGQ